MTNMNTMPVLCMLFISLWSSVHCQFIDPNPMTCGTPLVQPLENTAPTDVTPNLGSWPWMALVTEPNGNIYNSGSFIHPRVILSSAQHFASAGWSNIPHLRYWRVYTATSNFNMTDPQGGYYHIESVHIHPNYSAVSLENDVALVFTTETVRWNDKTRPACLPDATTSYSVSQTCIMPFWKQITKSGTQLAMTQVSMPILADDVCLGFFSSDVDPDQDFCAGNHDRGQTTCWEDIGSPLMCKEGNGAWYIKGLASWGGDCYNTTEPLVFKKVGKYSSWIKKTMADAGFTYSPQYL